MECDHCFFKYFLNRKQFISIFGAVLISFGITFLCFKSWSFNYLIGSVLILAENSSLANFWIKSPIEFSTNIYFFNWSNPQDFLNSSIKPELKEVGPYTFLLNTEKVNVIWNENDTVTYSNVRSWRTDEKQPNSNVTDKVTIFNCLTLYATYYIKDWNYFIKRLFSSVIDEAAPDLYVTKTANEFVMKGYSDIFVEIANYVPFIASEVPRFNKFGFLKMMNGSTLISGTFNMANGADGNFDVLQWNYANTTKFFNSKCAKVSGSAGEFYSRKRSKLYVDIFFPEICRSLKFDFEKPVYVEGVLGHKYSIGKSVLDNGTNVPGNDCYCNGDCLPYGMLNITSCKYNFPAYLSLPNFYGADSIYLNDIDGLHPEKDKHEMYVVLEPQTSILLEINIRMQFNVLVRPIDDINMYQNVRKMFFPIIWLEQSAVLPIDQINNIKLLLMVPTIIASITILLIILGAYLLFLAYKPLVFHSFKNFRRKKQNSNEIKLQST